MLLEDDDLPILRDIVQSGDKDIIRSARRKNKDINKDIKHCQSALNEALENSASLQGRVHYTRRTGATDIQVFDDTSANDTCASDEPIEQTLDRMVQDALNEHLDVLRDQLRQTLRSELHKLMQER